MKKIVFSFLTVLMLGLSGCNKPGDSISKYELIPAIYQLNFDLFQYTFKTPLGTVYSSEIQNAEKLYDGAMILTTFSVNHDQQTNDKYTIATNVGYTNPLNVEYAESTTGGESQTGDFDLFISGFDFFGSINYYCFFYFDHGTVKEDDKFLYEMTYDREQTGTPSVKIRAKKSSTGSSQICVFNLSSFYYTFRDNDTNIANFKVQLKTGEDADGNDVYTVVRDNYGNEFIFQIKAE